MLNKNGKYYTLAVHKLMAQCFLGPIPDGMGIVHLDNNVLNNKLENLQYSANKKFGVNYEIIPGYIDYRAGDDGTIWSIKTQTWIELVQTNNPKNRYNYVSLRKNGKTKKFYVHQLILMCFVGDCPSGYEAAHGDGNRINNNINNLRWATPKDNTSDKKLHKTLLYGENSPVSKLTTQQVLDIRTNKLKNKEYAKKYSISISYVSTIQNYKSWRHLK